MSDFVIVKKDPPPRRSNRGKDWSVVARALRDNPDQWLSIGTSINTSICSWNSRPKSLKFTCVDMVSRDTVKNRGEIFVRLDSEGPDFDEFVAQVI